MSTLARDLDRPLLSPHSGRCRTSLFPAEYRNKLGCHISSHRSWVLLFRLFVLAFESRTNTGMPGLAFASEIWIGTEPIKKMGLNARNVISAGSSAWIDFLAKPGCRRNRNSVGRRYREDSIRRVEYCCIPFRDRADLGTFAFSQYAPDEVSCRVHRRHPE